MRLLAQVDIDEIHRIAIDRRLFKQRDVLFSGIAATFAANCEKGSTDNAQLLLDLHALNAATGFVGNDVPFKAWLYTAASLIAGSPADAAKLHDLAGRIVSQPEPSVAETERVARAAIATLNSLSNERLDVRYAVDRAQEAIREIAVRLIRLVTRKRLHDILHRLQIEGLPLIQASVIRERFGDPAQLQMVADHLGFIETACSDARAELENLDPSWRDYRTEEKWIEQLATIFTAARNAVAGRAFEPARFAVMDLRRLIKLTMSRLNVALGYSMDELDIAALAIYLRNFANLSLEPVDPRAIELRDAATRLLLLEADIARLIEAHDQWQRFDDDLWSAEEDLMFREETASNLESFSRWWPGLSTGVQMLASDPAAPWYTTAVRSAADFQQKCPMPATPPLPPGARDDFRYFVKVTRKQFQEIDRELKGRCNRLATLTRPLQELGR